VRNKRSLNIVTQNVFLATFGHLYHDLCFMEFLVIHIQYISDAFTKIFILQLCLLSDCLQKEIT